MGCRGELLPMKYSEYVKRMAAEGRIFKIEENGRAMVLAFYGLTDEPEKFLEAERFEYLQHDPKGRTFVMEFMFSSHFKRAYFTEMKRFFYKKYPQIEQTMWLRESPDGNKIKTMRRHYEFHHSN